jgi:hypothetical protein
MAAARRWVALSLVEVVVDIAAIPPGSRRDTAEEVAS